MSEQNSQTDEKSDVSNSVTPPNILSNKQVLLLGGVLLIAGAAFMLGKSQTSGSEKQVASRIENDSSASSIEHSATPSVKTLDTSRLTKMLQAFEALDSKLGIGMSYNEYVDNLKNLKAEYDQVEVTLSDEEKVHRSRILMAQCMAWHLEARSWWNIGGTSGKFPMNQPPISTYVAEFGIPSIKQEMGEFSSDADDNNKISVSALMQGFWKAIGKNLREARASLNG